MPVPGMKCDGTYAVVTGTFLIFCQLLLRLMVLLSEREESVIFIFLFFLFAWKEVRQRAGWGIRRWHRGQVEKAC